MNQRKVGIILSYISQAVKILSGVLFTPIMLRILGQSEYGLYQLVNSVVSYLSLLSLGFESAYIRFYSKEKAKNDYDAISKINGMFFIIFLIITIICILCGLIMCTNVSIIFGSKLNIVEYSKAKTLMLIMTINLSLSILNSIFNSIIASQECFIFQKSLLLMQYLLSPFITLPLLLSGFGSVGVVVITTLLTLLSLISNIYYCLVKLHISFSFDNLNFSLLKEMWHFTFFIFINQIVDQINWSVDKFLLGRILGTMPVAIYGISSQINAIYTQLSTSISSVFIPRVNKISEESNNNSELSSLFIKVGRIQFIVMSLVLSGFIIFGKPFIVFWAGINYKESYYATLLLIVPVTIPLIQNLGIEIQRAKNKHKIRSVVYLLISIINILLSIPLIKKYGTIGAALGTAVSLIIGNIVFMNWYYYKALKIDVIGFWNSILSFMPSLILPSIVGFIFISIEYNTILSLLICIIIYTIIFCLSMYFFGMNNYEKLMISNFIDKISK